MQDPHIAGGDERTLVRPACQAGRRVEVCVSKGGDSGRNPTLKAFREAERVSRLHPEQQRAHPSSVPADSAKLAHINTYGALPAFYMDYPFVCRSCGKREIWKARDQKWYYEEAKGHIDAKAILCHACRKSRKGQ
jgi:hypothetical protein